MLPLSAAFGVSSVVAGAYVSEWVGFFATGPTIVVASTLQFVCVLALAPRYGMVADWWRRRSMVPQRHTGRGVVSAPGTWPGWGGIVLRV